MKYIKKIAAGLVIGFLICMFYLFDTFYLIENNMRDRLINFSENQEVDYRIKILAIDDQSLNEIGSWPWPRDVIASLAAQLAQSGAAAVWTDVLYVESGSNPNEDRFWESITKQYPNVYHSAYFSFPPRQKSIDQFKPERLHWPIFSVPKQQAGHINVIPDNDNKIRQVILGIEDPTAGMIPAISVRLSNLLLPDNQLISWKNGHWYSGNQPIVTGHMNNVYFQYSSEPQLREQDAVNAFEIYSIKDVMNGTIPTSYFANSVVLIGPYSVGLGDQYFTPVSNKIPMFGVEIHANIIQSILNNYIYTVASPVLGSGIILLLSILSYALVSWVRARWSIFIVFLLTIVYSGLLLYIFHSFHVLLPYIYVVLVFLITYIASVVVQYVQEQREKKRVTGIFGRYVSKRVVDEILSNHDEIKVGGVRREVTLMFVDIRGFTPLSESMEPEEVVEILNEYLDLGARSIFSYEGTVDKFMGDGIMAFFGAPVEQKDHAKRAARAALAMKKEGQRMAERLREKYGKTVAFGIGIHSGPAVIGNIGSNDRLEYTAIGDTVNLAARLESNAKPEQILVSQAAYEFLQDDFKFTPLDPLKVKGKSEKVQVYQLEGEL
ncbi:MAG: adenylate/guanylate cyclase domain-containing protein [Bacillaceae bacterium]|nr:adenylate/guanylate cyclase domain-containing protein [Bacillaceae bacterium]